MSNFHRIAINKELFRIRESREPNQIGQVWIAHLENGLDEFKEMVKSYGLTCKFMHNTGCYFVEPDQLPIRAKGRK
jgi:hypothetical protein